MAMTNKEHDDAWLDVMTRQIPEIKKQLQIRNAIEIVKELHALGEMSDEVYINSMIKFLNGAGFTARE